MSRLRLVAGLLGVLWVATAVPAAETPGAEPGFVPLFDGKTLEGWQTTGNWIVEDGGMVALHPRPGERGWQRYDAYLTTARKYKDFVLDLEFKIGPGGNSGVFLRVGDRMSQVATGFEIQILDTHGLEKPGNHDCGGLIGAAAPTKNMAKPAGQWNRYVITCQGNRLKVELMPPPRSARVSDPACLPCLPVGRQAGGSARRPATARGAVRARCCFRQIRTLGPAASRPR